MVKDVKMGINAFQVLSILTAYFEIYLNYDVFPDNGFSADPHNSSRGSSMA
jgi:hypothetical protein